MQYSTPDLVVLGPAAMLVQGGPPGELDNVMTTVTQPAAGLALGIDE